MLNYYLNVICNIRDKNYIKCCFTDIYMSDII